MRRFRTSAEQSSPKRRRGQKLVIRPVGEPPVPPSVTDSAETDLRMTDASPILIKRRNRRGWQLWLLWLSCLLGLGGLGAAAFFLLATLPPQVNCRQLTPLSPDMDRLHCAQLAAQSGKLDQLVESMKFVESLPANHPLASEVERMMGEWSESILKLSRQKMNQGDLQGAIAIARQMPVSSPLYSQAQATIQKWKTDWQQAQLINVRFQASLKAKDWLVASQQVQALRHLESDYWKQKPLDQLMDKLASEKQAWQLLEEARQFAQSNLPDQLATAIALADKVKSDTYIKAEANVDKGRWSRDLLKVAAIRFQQQDFAGVVDAAHRVPADTPVYSEAQDWMQLSRAYLAAQENHLLGSLEAQTAVQKIAPASPLYRRAKFAEMSWQAQFHDQLQLSLAGAVASLDQPLMFQLAIDQAQLIAPQRPQRIQAQTLIAHWRQQIQRIEDRAILAQAKQLALPDTLDSLRGAVAQASLIEQGRPRRIEAQTWIAQWTQRIEVLEDQPILKLAKSFAEQGNLKAAVQAAQQIRPGRALYAETQVVLGDWIAQIQIAEDRPILDEATALAAQGRLTDAINKAAQIRSGRALYDEAQSEIARWVTEREVILSARRPRKIFTGNEGEVNGEVPEESSPNNSAEPNN